LYLIGTCRLFGLFFTFPFSPFLIFLLEWLTFYWACFQFKNPEKASLRWAIPTTESSVVEGSFPLSFSLKFLSIFMHISGSNDLITLIWVLLERSFPPAELDYNDANFGQRWWCQKWNKCHCSSWRVTASTGISGLLSMRNADIILKSWNLNQYIRYIFFGRMDIPGFKLVGQSQIVQSVIYGSDTVVTQVLTAAVLSLGSQLGFFPFAEYDRIKTW